MALAVLALASAPAFAGPNDGGTLVVHDTGLAYTVDSASYPSDAPECAGHDVNIPLEMGTDTAGWVWKVYAAFPLQNSPRVKALALSEAFDATVIVLGGGLPDPVGDFDIPQGGWPLTTGGADGISFGTVKTTSMVEVYWFGGYAYGGTGLFAAAPHPNPDNRFFIDDSVPPVQDPIVGYGSVGFGIDGVEGCPALPVEGACCFTDGHCEMLLADACIAAGGSVYGGPCDPNPCPPPPVEAACCLPDGSTCIIATQDACLSVNGEWLEGQTCEPNPCVIPVEETTWGQIKANYR
jgi:hypothetical protein